jgi:hypothetical protein
MRLAALSIPETTHAAVPAVVVFVRTDHGPDPDRGVPR